MTDDSDAEAPEALQADSWRQQMKNRGAAFAARVPRVDKELALKLVDQVPNLTTHARDLMDRIHRDHQSTRDSNERSQEHVHQAYQDARNAAKVDLERDDLSPEERERLHERLFDSADKENQKDSENKRFLTDLAKIAAVLGISVVGVLALIAQGAAAGREGRPAPSDTGPAGPS
jgi:hypothetical protein